jgi:putative transcriptional regulator
MTMVSGKPRRSGRGRIARTAEPSYNGVAADNQGSLRQGMPEVTPVEIRAAVAHSAQEPTETTHFGSVEVSAVGIPSLQAGEDVKNHPNRSRGYPAANPTPPNPTPLEIESARKAAGLSQAAAAKLVHATLNAWQKWEAGDRRMHPAFWELFRIKIGGA